MSTVSPVSTRLRVLAVLCCLSLVAVACGDDDDEATATADETTTTAAEGEGEAEGADSEYCRLSAEMNEQDGPPSPEQLEALREAAPEEIKAEADVVVDAFVAAEGDFGKVFSDPAVEENLGAIEEYDAEVCGIDNGGEEDEPDTEPIEGAQVVPVTAVDFAFEGLPAEIPAGPTSFEFTNDGEAAHEMAVFKLGEGVDLDALLASEEEPTESEAQEVGFTFSEPGGDTTYLNAEDLAAGTYAVVCFIPGPEGKPHYELGMKTTFTVA